MQFLKDELIRVANQRTFRLLLNYALEVWGFHDFATQQHQSHLLENLQYSFIEDNMVLLYLCEIAYEIVDLLFAQLQPMHQLFVHQLP